MKRVFRFFSSLVKAVREFFIVAYAKNRYTAAVHLADDMNAATGKPYYVVIDPVRHDRIVVMDRAAFRRIKRTSSDHYIRMQGVLNSLIRRRKERARTRYDRETDAVLKDYLNASRDIRDRRSMTEDQTMREVYEGCFYSTRLRSEGMEAHIEARRLSYIRWILSVSEGKRRKPTVSCR